MQGCSVIDYGAGSGVLGIAALRLGAASAAATDVDPCAVSACRCNAELNGVGGRLLALQGERDLQVRGVTLRESWDDADARTLVCLV